MEFADGTRNREKTQMAFLQKYYHKGAFHTVSTLHRIQLTRSGGRRAPAQPRLHRHDDRPGGHVLAPVRPAGPRLWKGAY
jgi:hypothetical protein